ncbi:hypothetical protein KR222_005148 [Zaprionus bogoriensis]|nr:hypothetical protein KR222_005148 [Zaprionus bogoriensis]
MSHLLRRTKKSCLKLLRRISTSKQLFVQRLDEDEEDVDVEQLEQQLEQEQEQEELEQQLQVLQVQLRLSAEKQCGSNSSTSNTNSNNNTYTNTNTNTNSDQPQPSVQCVEFACKAEPELPPPQVNSIDIQFDLMQYKANVRYLRHTPSNSNSNSNCSLNLQLEPPATTSTSTSTSAPAPAPSTAFAPRNACSVVSVGSQFDGQYHNVIIMEQPPNEDYPIVKWDINGNSLDEEHFDLRRHWDAFDSRWRQLQSSHSQSQSQPGRRLGSGQSQRSSHHSSSCTLETWIDDAEPGLCDDSQNLLQINHNSNCNQCLKSF